MVIIALTKRNQTKPNQPEPNANSATFIKYALKYDFARLAINVGYKQQQRQKNNTYLIKFEVWGVKFQI